MYSLHTRCLIGKCKNVDMLRDKSPDKIIQQTEPISMDWHTVENNGVSCINQLILE